MNKARLLLLVCVVTAASACSYEGLRMSERHKCTSMPQSEAERCFNRTQMTKTEYASARRKLAAKDEAQKKSDEEKDPRYERWLP